MARKHRKQRHQPSGFSLPELLIAASLGVLVTIVAADAMISHLRSNARAESLQRQRDDWARASSFVESEIAMSERIFSKASDVVIPTSCGISNTEFRMALDVSRNLPVIIYGIKRTSDLPLAEQAGWVGDRVLVRCGPSLAITADGSGDYVAGTPTASVLLDGLDPLAAGEGFNITSNTAKSASFTLAVKGLVSSRYSFGSGSYSRINPVTGFPEDLSTCDRICTDTNNDGVIECRDVGGFYVIKGNYNVADNITVPYEAIQATDNVTVCGLGGGDTIEGSDVNDVIDAGRYNLASGTVGATIDGKKGRNYLLGTPGNDSLIGGPDADTIVGRGGNDSMIGGSGTNSYSPWPDLASTTPPGAVTITGGTGLDVVYIRGNKNLFGNLSSCTKSGCSLSTSGGSLNMTGVDVLIFKDGRVDLP
jgi:hypothetical protein